jgi:hypothetical protein
LAAQTVSSVIISEVQTGGLSASGAEDGKKEFIELYNTNEQPVDLTGWHLEYLSASHAGVGPPTRVLSDLSGHIQAKGSMLVAYKDYIAAADLTFGQDSTATGGLLARSGGHVRLVAADGQTIDLVAWGSATKIGAWWKAPEIPPNFSIQRQLGQSEQTFDAPTSQTSPAGGGWLPDVHNTPLCSGVVLSEILPNPGGTDSGHEYIELYNPTNTVINLEGCSIGVGETSKTYAFPDGSTIAAGAYVAYYDSQTGLALPNATAQSVRLVTTSEESTVLYMDDMSDDTAWAYIQGVWQATKQPTPGAPNVLLSETLPDPGAPNEGSEAQPTPISCPAGKERNPETNRCRTIPPPISVAACKPGQERNPDTGRCKALTTLASPAACKPNQVRNPETNRCKAVAATTVAKDCPVGQVRNAETNRCRKATPSPANLSKVADVTAKQPPNGLRLWIVGIVGIGAVGYAAYEWRTELYARFRKVRPKGKSKM